MLRQACAVTLVLLVTLGTGGFTAQEAEASEPGRWSDRVELRVFEYDVIFAQRDIFRLDWDIDDPKGGGEGFERYYFEITPHEQMGLQEGLAVATLEVTRQSTTDLICRGTIGNLNGEMEKKQFCDDIRAGHFYAIDYTIPIPADITLYGVNPIGPVKR